MGESGDHFFLRETIKYTSSSRLQGTHVYKPFLLQTDFQTRLRLVSSEFSFVFALLCRFKNHLFDLTFMEKVTRWLTNTQVKVKSEVSN